LVIADDGPVHRQGRALERGTHLDGVEPDAGALVDARVAGDDGAGIDEGPTGAVGIDAAAGIAGAIVRDRAVVDGQRPGGAGRGVLHGDTAAVGGRDVVGDDHVGQRQVGVTLIADAAAAAGGPVAGLGDAVLDGESLQGHQQLGGGVVGVV